MLKKRTLWKAKDNSNTTVLTKFAVQLTATPMAVAAGRGPCLKSSPVMSQGMEPGPRAKKTTNPRVETMRKTATPSLEAGSRFCATVMRTQKRMMPARPPRWRVRRPRRSISGIVTKVIVTMMAPTPRVAYYQRTGRAFIASNVSIDNQGFQQQLKKQQQQQE